VAGIEWQRRAAIKKARVERFRQRDRDAEQRYLAAKNAAAKERAS